MENNDWYNQYQQNNTVQPPVRQKQKKSIGIPGLIACMLVTALIGGALGSVFTGISLSRRNASSAAVEPQQQIAEATPVPAQSEQAAAAVQPAAPSVSSLLTQSSGTGSYTRAQIVEVGAPSVVGIDVEYVVDNSAYYGFYYFFGGNGGSNGSQTAKGSGSGVVVTSDGYIVTCNHVVEKATKITVITNDETSYEAKLIGTDERNDLAVIKIEATGLAAATLGDSDMLTVGEDVVAIGNPLGELRGTSTAGIVSALNRKVTVEDTEMSLIQHDAAVSPGSSGGGLFNGSGSLVGIVNAKASSNNAEGIGFAIPVSSVKTIISDLIEHGYVKGRAYLGVYTQNVTLQADRRGYGSWFGYSNTIRCVQVGQVIAGGAAEAAGIQAQDLILQIDDYTVSSTDDLSKVLNRYNAGDTATVLIQRNGQQQEISVTFGEYIPQT